jgi:hypothetical protein
MLGLPQEAMKRVKPAAIFIVGAWQKPMDGSIAAQDA